MNNSSVECGGPEKGRWGYWCSVDLSSFSSDSSSQLDVLRHDGYSLSVDGTQVGVLKQTNQVSLTGLLESHDSRALEPQISLEVLGNLSHQTLEWQFSDEQLSGFLVSPDLSQSYSSWSGSVRLLHSSSSWSTLPRSLGCQLFPWGLASSGFPCCLLCSCHVDSRSLMIVCRNAFQLLYSSQSRFKFPSLANDHYWLFIHIGQPINTNFNGKLFIFLYIYHNSNAFAALS